MELLDLDGADWVLKSNMFYFYIREPAGNLKNDKAVSFGILNKVWVFISALISAPLLIIFLSPALQGFYYTFNSILRCYSWLTAIMFTGLFAGGYYFIKNSHSAPRLI